MNVSLRRIATATIGVFAFAATFGGASAATSSQQASLQALVGTWTCVTHTSDGKTYKETDTDAMFGNWVRSDSSYPAQAGQPAGHGVTFIGYDAKHGHWVVTGVGQDGSYFTASSTSPAFDGSKWTDVYPADHGTALLHMPAGTSYTMVSSGPNMQGKMTTSHTACTKG